MSSDIRASLVGQQHGGDDELQQQVYDITLEEVEKGWLDGPFTAQELDKKLGLWVPSRRFGIRQGKKIRAIDDYAASKINLALSAVEAVDPDDLDRIGVNARLHLEAFAVRADQRSECSQLSGAVCHKDYVESQLVSRMWDL